MVNMSTDHVFHDALIVGCVHCSESISAPGPQRVWPRVPGIGTEERILSH